MKQLAIQPSEFWSMTPRHFWWLFETLRPQKRGVSLSDEERSEIMGWLKGNDTGGF